MEVRHFLFFTIRVRPNCPGRPAVGAAAARLSCFPATVWARATNNLGFTPGALFEGRQQTFPFACLNEPQGHLDTRLRVVFDCIGLYTPAASVRASASIRWESRPLLPAPSALCNGLLVLALQLSGLFFLYGIAAG